MKRRFRLTPEARADLRLIWEYIAQDKVIAAERLLDRFESAFFRIAQFPHRGHARPEVRTSEPVLFWPVGNYVHNK